MEEKKEREKPKRPNIPLYLKCHDLQLIEGGELHTAQRRLTALKKKAGLGKHDKLSIYRYCDLMGLTVQQVMPFYLRLLIAVATISMTLAFAKMAIEYSCDFFRKHKMYMDEATPTHLKEHTFIYDPQTKRMEKTTITIDKIK